MVEQKTSAQKKVSLHELLLNSPLHGENIDLSRDKDFSERVVPLED